MDEVEALAQQVAVLARGKIVASGSPASLGGRDQGRVSIRFTLPPGVAMADLPIAPSHVDGAAIEINTDDELTVLNRLTSWAIERQLALVGLSVNRETLEDVYLALTHQAADRAEGAAHE
jgi:ABC-2 type transport system ATP-binding protein